jgi:hypothetical protein
MDGAGLRSMDGVLSFLYHRTEYSSAAKGIKPTKVQVATFLLVNCVMENLDHISSRRRRFNRLIVKINHYPSFVKGSNSVK